jgi:hypothetical protein
MAIKALILIPFGMMLCGASCQTTDEKADKRMQTAAVVQGQTAAKIPPIVPIAACIAHMERVQLRDEPWVIFKFRWEVAADNRDKLADDCAAWIADLNKRSQ